MASGGIVHTTQALLQQPTATRPVVFRLSKRIEGAARRRSAAAITERILREARLEDQVATAIAAFKPPSGAKLAKGIKDLFKREPDANGTTINAIAASLKPKELTRPGRQR